MKTRSITAAIAFLCFLPFLIFSDGFLWNVAVAIISGVCMFEILCCIKIPTAYGLSIPAILYAITLPLLCQGLSSTLSNGATLFLFLMFTIGVFSKNRYHTSQITLVSALCLFLTNALTSLVVIRRQECGILMLILVLIIAWGSDTSAYVCGRLFGTRKLAPELSPKKTVEGSIGSVIITVILCVVFGLIVNAFSLAQADIGLLALIGLIGNLFAQMGDLIASLFKRHYSIKDFGTVFPGHGGFLDRFDSVVGVCVLMLMVSSRPELLPLFTVIA
ncbi:MAG: phosphatidate cytidylyltransferase [Clostridia bacterium]|nr:phosphatidate cytidylyltransferase [Clostridia bacterium]